MNDLITITDVCQQRSRMTRLIIIRPTALKFLACKNQIQLVILELCDLGHQTGSLRPYTVYANVGQFKVNNNRVMCQMSLKLPAIFGQNPSHTFDKIVKKLITTKNALKA